MKKFLILLVIIGCSSSHNEELLDKSMEVHEAALKIGKEAKGKIDQINELSVQLEDSVVAAVMMDSVSTLTAAWESWEESVVEVPGREHEGHDHDHHDHDHDHDHDHSASPDLTPEMVLEIQEDLKARASRLDARAQSILSTLK